VTALAKKTGVDESTWKTKQFTLASGKIAYQGGIACLDRSTGKVVPGAASSTLVMIGTFTEDVDASAADALVNVDLIREITVRWYANAAGGDAVGAADIGKDCYLLDDATVTITGAAHSLAGRVWAVDATRGVAVEKLAPAEDLARQPALPAFAAGDCAPTAIVHGAVYALPATAAASTVTLPSGAPDGTIAYFAANGTDNGHTVQYRDATGPTNLTTALLASKRHLAVATKTGGKWFVNAYVSP